MTKKDLRKFVVYLLDQKIVGAFFLGRIFFADFLLVHDSEQVEKEAAGEHGWRPLGSLVYSEAEPCSLTTQWGIFNWIVASSLRAK